MKEVTKQKFEEFVNQVDFPYTKDLVRFCSPPVMMYYKTPFTDVRNAECFAKVVLGDGMYDIVGDNYYINEQS